MFTKDIKSIYKNMDKIVDSLDDKLSTILLESKSILKNHEVLMNGNKITYNNNLFFIYPSQNLNRLLNYSGTYKAEIQVIENDIKKLDLDKNFKWRMMYRDECEEIIKDKEFFYYLNTIGIVTKTRIISFKEKNKIYSIAIGEKEIRESTYLVIPICKLSNIKKENYRESFILKLWLENNLIPTNTNYKDDYNILICLAKNNLISEKNNRLFVNKDRYVEFLKNNITEDRTINANELINSLLNCDKERADIEEYDEKILKDPNRGHWDLWGADEDKGGVEYFLKEPLIARNPVADIKSGGVVGIDFGTKSTVVVHQEDSEYTLPMRVGIGQFRKKIDSKHYENPTVMEFINLNNFLDEYNKSVGRPNTKWEDTTVSHTAFSSFLNSKSDEYYAYFNELKQWCGGKNKRIRIKDKSNNIYDLPTFLEINEEEFNPVEIYAYYIGVYINNMHNGIYMDYILSFPVTYEKEVRDKIINSFEKGIKKSLPKEIVNNEELMESFRVSEGASEPAAYAISALQEYGFEPEDDEKVFYGVFDFGGGTTDFDFGIFRDATGKRERKYDFVVEHFGAGGDRYLGGENLLELMAFELLKANLEELREKNITFSLPAESKKFPGCEVLLSESQEAKINMRHVMEKLRPLWERTENYEDIYSKGIVATNMFDKNGKMITNVQLKIDIEEMNSLLRNRIDKGIRNFFESLRIAFDNDKIRDINKINIFLAGNSSKSTLVTEIFNEYIERESREIIKATINESDEIKEIENIKHKKIFEIFPPLGTEEAYKKQEELGIEVCRDNFKKPTGKTGVAFGIVESRPGGNIKVINMNQENKETKFRFYVGENRRKKFKYIISTESKYNEWYEFTDAYEEDFEIYYTSLPEASTNSLPISEVSRIKCRLKETFDEDDIFVYVRPITPSEIEYVVASEEGINKEEYLTELVKIQLD